MADIPAPAKIAKLFPISDMYAGDNDLGSTADAFDALTVLAPARPTIIHTPRAPSSDLAARSRPSLALLTPRSPSAHGRQHPERGHAGRLDRANDRRLRRVGRRRRISQGGGRKDRAVLLAQLVVHNA